MDRARRQETVLQHGRDLRNPREPPPGPAHPTIRMDLDHQGQRTGNQIRHQRGGRGTRRTHRGIQRTSQRDRETGRAAGPTGRGPDRTARQLPTTRADRPGSMAGHQEGETGNPTQPRGKTTALVEETRADGARHRHPARVGHRQLPQDQHAAHRLHLPGGHQPAPARPDRRHEPNGQERPPTRTGTRRPVLPQRIQRPDHMEEDQREGRSRTTPQKRPHRPRTADHRRQPDRGPRPRTMRQTHTRQIPDPAGRQGQSHPHQRQRRKRVRRRQARPIHQPGDP